MASTKWGALTIILVREKEPERCFEILFRVIPVEWFNGFNIFGSFNKTASSPVISIVGADAGALEAICNGLRCVEEISSEIEVDYTEVGSVNGLALLARVSNERINLTQEKIHMLGW